VLRDIVAGGLLPRRLRPAGLLLFLAGTALAVARFRYFVKPAFLDTTTFAMRSTYLETKSFTLITNNLTDELAALLALTGLLLLAFSRETTEDSGVRARRLQAWMLTGWLHAGLVACAVLFLYGLAFTTALLAFLFTPFVSYVAIFWWLGSRRQMTRNE
jgi:hypothetical protein